MAVSNAFTFSDPFPYQAALRISDVEVFPTAKGQFQAELRQINLKQLWMQHGHENLPHIVAGTVSPVRKAITFLTKEREMVYCGQDVLPGSIIIQRTDTQHRRNGADRHWGSMSLPHDVLHAAFKALSGREYSEAALGFILRPDLDLMSRLLKAHETVGNIAETMPDILEMPEALRALEHQLVHLMIRCMCTHLSSAASAGERRHDLIVARFEAFLEANSNEPLYLTEICAAVGVSERTLRVVCEEHLGMGPIRYLSLRRMHLVRRALLRADPSTTTVTRIATDHGFWELGRFSVAYRSLFGDSPSDSLRRRSADRPGVANLPSSLEISSSFH
jgi:AraC-like DNA-binding protein